MALIFRTSEEINKELGRSNEFENLGTLEKLLPKGTKIKFGKRNFSSPAIKANGKPVNVVVVATSKDNKLAFINCSEPISASVRKLAAAGKTKAELLGWLTSLEVIENEKGMFISRPMGEAGESLEIGKLPKITTEDLSELLAW